MRLSSFVSAHIIITRFDDIYGPQIVLDYPKLIIETQIEVVPLITKLLDLQTKSTDWQFMYADQTFASQNIIFSHAKKRQDDSRDSILEFGISVVLLPPNEKVVRELYGIWTYLTIIKEICAPYLYNLTYSNLPMDQLSVELDAIVNELNNQFNNESDKC